MLYDWCQERTLPSQPIRRKTKANRDLITVVFPCQLRVFASSSHWFIVLFTFLVIVHCNNYFIARVLVLLKRSTLLLLLHYLVVDSTHVPLQASLHQIHT